MLAYTSLRYGDTRLVHVLWLSDTAFCGISVNNKDKSGLMMNWATPLIGLRPKSKWYDPIIRFWPMVKPNGGKFAALFPHVLHGRNIDYSRAEARGVVQEKLDVIAKELGFTARFKLHSFLNWAPTCARQLRIRREERELIGNWAPGSKMPDRYDKSVCSTELKIMESILQQVRSGRRHQKDFEVGREGDNQEKPALVRTTPRRPHLPRVCLRAGETISQTYWETARLCP